MRNILLLIFIFFNFSLYAYNEDEIICIEFMKTEIHYAWSNNFDFLPPILENCVQNIN